MPGKKTVSDVGQVLDVETDRFQKIKQPEPTISYTQAKKLNKRPMTDKQKEHVQQMVEANRQKWEAKRKEKEEQQQQQQQQREEMIKEQKITPVKVLPKRVYPPRTKKAPKTDTELNEIYEESSSTDESEYEIVYKTPKTKNKNTSDELEIIKQKTELLKQYQAIKSQPQPQPQPQPTNRYLNMIKF